MADTSMNATGIPSTESFGLQTLQTGASGGTAGQDQCFDQELWRRIERMKLDDPTVEMPISRRLAAENKWNGEQTRRAILEYKRFIYLTQRAGFEVTPSRPVDLVWHEHLMHTEHYWSVLCGEVLRNHLHHRPGRGGDAEAARLSDQYGRTLDAYRAAFGFDPPADVWPRPASTAKTGFGKLVFAGVLAVGVVFGWIAKLWPLVIVCGFLLLAVFFAAPSKGRQNRGGCGSGCGSGGIGSSGCSDSSSDGGGCGGGD